jgi:hypothetical protein
MSKVQIQLMFIFSSQCVLPQFGRHSKLLMMRTGKSPLGLIPHPRLYSLHPASGCPLLGNLLGRVRPHSVQTPEGKGTRA